MSKLRISVIGALRHYAVRRCPYGPHDLELLPLPLSLHASQIRLARFHQNRICQTFPMLRGCAGLGVMCAKLPKAG
ncbi:hypothetical protein IQ07DRAFT_583532 [Pyrenochaeta sp. DS3sAY3a]|nr:hypothetical protein IQ07DRAFT_583532 [Pyrenochaeta sp. DS3sAY3a]